MRDQEHVPESIGVQLKNGLGIQLELSISLIRTLTAEHAEADCAWKHGLVVSAERGLFCVTMR